jgi:hypothetical protein
MSEIATYYVTLKPIREGAQPAFGWRNIAYVNDPAIEEVGVYLNAHDPRLVADELVQAKILEYLKTVGIVKPENWIEVTEEEYLSKRSINLGIEDSESYNDFQKKGGGGQWLVRYEYKGPNDDKTRSFCSEVLSLGRLYTEEEITNGLVILSLVTILYSTTKALMDVDTYGSVKYTLKITKMTRLGELDSCRKL